MSSIEGLKTNNLKAAENNTVAKSKVSRAKLLGFKSKLHYVLVNMFKLLL